MVSGHPGNAQLASFPATGTGGPVMPRMTITSAATTAGSGYSLNLPLAQAMFTLTDDLVVDQPDDRTLPGTGHMILDSSNKPIKRDYEGLYTWLATLTPQNGNTLGAVPMNQMLLSIVVFNRRLLAIPTSGSGQEEMVDVTDSSGNPPAAGTVNIGGGDLTLKDTTAQADAKLALAKPGNWMMLCRQDKDAAGNNYNIFKWYRIISAAEGSSSGTADVTLNGPDWVWGGPTYKTYACLFDGAVAVYQRVIHLDGPSVWSQ